MTSLNSHPRFMSKSEFMLKPTGKDAQWVHHATGVGLPKCNPVAPTFWLRDLRQIIELFWVSIS